MHEPTGDFEFETQHIVPKSEIDQLAEQLGIAAAPALIEDFNHNPLGRLPLPNEPATPNVFMFGDELEAEQLLREFDALPPEERRLAFAKFFDVDPDQIALVRKGNELKMTQLSAADAEHMKQLGEQGYKTISYTNRKQRRAAKAQARHAKR